MNKWFKLALFSIIGILISAVALNFISPRSGVANNNYVNPPAYNHSNPGYTVTPNPGAQYWSGYGRNQMNNWMNYGMNQMNNGMNYGMNQMQNGMNYGMNQMNNWMPMNGGSMNMPSGSGMSGGMGGMGMSGGMNMSGGMPMM